MNKKDYIIIGFFVLVFAIVLYQKKFSTGLSGSGLSAQESHSERESVKGQQTKMNNDIVEKAFSDFEASVSLLDKTTDDDNDPAKEIKPPSGVNRSSYYDQNGQFKSGYSGTEPPAEFLTKKEFFTDQRKMQQDIEFKMMKMFMDMENEKKEFERTHDERGKDRAIYEELKKNHTRMIKIISNKNADILREFRAELNQYDSELR